MKNYEEAEKAFDEAYYLNEDDFEAALVGMAETYLNLVISILMVSMVLLKI